MRRRPVGHGGRREVGAALLAAMLTVMLVATFSAAALWQQWRAVEVESAERARVQAAWVLVGALDWARLILREDGRAGGPDHLAEPWAVPLEEARLSSFLAAEKNVASDSVEGLPDAFMSGRIVDAQAKLNVRNLVVGGKPVPAAVESFVKLFQLLDLPQSQLEKLVGAIAGALGQVDDAASAGADNGPAALMPQHPSQLVWLGLSSETAAALEPYVTVLPLPTPVNINTASAEVLFASVPKLDLAAAKRFVERRTQGHFMTLADANTVVGSDESRFGESQHSVSTRFFEVRGRLRLGQIWVEENSLLRRDGISLKVLWRERGAGATDLPPKG